LIDEEFRKTCYFLTEKGTRAPALPAAIVEPPAPVPAAVAVADEDLDDAEEDDTEDEEDADSEPSTTDDDAEFADNSTSSSHHMNTAVTVTAAHAAELQSSDRVVMRFLMPWAEVVTHRNDAVKSLTAGYASLDWAPGDMRRLMLSRSMYS